jgi:hypothetical protein
MACGDISWWRAPDFVGLLQRHGQVEHLVVQFDFLVQPQRDGRAEYSLPGASKTQNGQTGFADIVSIATGEIWEIKSEKLEDNAVKEAVWYVDKAKLACSPNWRAGTSFTTKDGTGIVYRLEGNGNKAELVARQGRAGAVIYFWRINGRKQPSLEPFFAWALRQQIVSDYFSTGQTLQPIPGSKAPNDFPPGKFKPPRLLPGGCIPQLNKFLPTLTKSVQTTCAQTVFENGAVAILLEASVFNAIVGPSIVAQQMGLMQVKPPASTEKLYKEAMDALAVAEKTARVLAVVIGIEVVLGLIILGGIELAGGAFVFACEATPVAATAAVTTEGLIGSLIAGVRASQALRAVVAAGAAILVFAIPRASMADEGTPVAFDVSVPKLKVLKPSEVTKWRVGQSTTIDGAEWIVAGIAKTLPDPAP